MEANVYNTSGRKIGSILCDDVFDLENLFIEHTIGSVRYFKDGYKMTLNTLKEVKSAVESKPFLKKDFSVIVD